MRETPLKTHERNAKVKPPAGSSLTFPVGECSAAPEKAGLRAAGGRVVSVQLAPFSSDFKACYFVFVFLGFQCFFKEGRRLFLVGFKLRRHKWCQQYFANNPSMCSPYRTDSGNRTVKVGGSAMGT